MSLTQPQVDAIGEALVSLKSWWSAGAGDGPRLIIFLDKMRHACDLVGWPDQTPPPPKGKP